jgi:hypothetical protein
VWLSGSKKHQRSKKTKIKTLFFWAQNSVRDVTIPTPISSIPISPSSTTTSIPTPIPFDFGTDGFGIVASRN